MLEKVRVKRVKRRRRRHLVSFSLGQKLSSDKWGRKGIEDKREEKKKEKKNECATNCENHHEWFCPVIGEED